MTVDDMLAKAGLPGVRDVRVLVDGRGSDNHLSLVTLTDGRQLLLRQPIGGEARDQAPRAAFLERHQVGAPRVYASAPDGTSLVEWIPGTPLADYLASGDNDPIITDRVWRRLGLALAAVHALTFPAPLQGQVGPCELTLRPTDPVGELHESLRYGEQWIRDSRPPLSAAVDPLHRLIDRYTNEIRAERPCLLHGDVNLDNVIVTDEAVRLIDWDHPRVGYPIAEVGALDEHAYLNGYSHGLPPAFWGGYGRTAPTPLLLIYRAVGCLGWLAGPEWSEWEADASMSAWSKAKLRRWHERLTHWADGLPRRLADPTWAAGS